VVEVALVEVVLDRERRGQEVERVEPLARARQALRHLVAVPQLRLEVGVPDVVDHEVALGERREPFRDVRVEGVVARVRDRVVALLHRAEARLGAGDDADGDVRQGADQDGVVVADRLLEVGRRRLALVDRGAERGLVLAAVRAHVVAVDEVADEVRGGEVVGALVPPGLEGGAEPLGERGEGVGDRSVEGESHTREGSSRAWADLRRRSAAARALPYGQCGAVGRRESHPGQPTSVAPSPGAGWRR